MFFLFKYQVSKSSIELLILFMRFGGWLQRYSFEEECKFLYASFESLTQVYSIESDVWMFGYFLCFPFSSNLILSVLVWEMLKDGEQPYRKLRNTQVVKQVQKGLRLQLDNNWPPALNEVLSRCWKKDPKLRPTATEFLQVLEEITGHTTSPRGRGSVV